MRESGPPPLTDWDEERSASVFVHMLNSQDWTRVTGETPPSTPISKEAHAKRGIPWFDHYREDLSALPGGQGLEGIRSTGEMGATVDIPEVDDSLAIPGATIQTGPHRRPRTGRAVKDGEF